MEHVGRLFLGLIAPYQSWNDHDCVGDLTLQAIAFINKRSVRLANPAHHASFLDRPPSHRKLFDLAVEMGMSPA
ncbi:MAG: hypothetical protein H0T93_13520 [Chloroflexia bacterium]|nr:hypothetical protein [Chloroflexia bacterium]